MDPQSNKVTQNFLYRKEACVFVAVPKFTRSTSVKYEPKIMAAYFWREPTNIIGFRTIRFMRNIYNCLVIAVAVEQIPSHATVPHKGTGFTQESGKFNDPSLLRINCKIENYVYLLIHTFVHT